MQLAQAERDSEILPPGCEPGRLAITIAEIAAWFGGYTTAGLDEAERRVLALEGLSDAHQD